jgi:hypothetical protein
VGRGAGALLAVTFAAGALRAQEVRTPERPVPPRLTVELRRGAEGDVAPPIVRAEDLLRDGTFLGALHDGFPVAFHFRLSLWRDATLFDRLEREASWEAVVRLDPLTNEYDLLRTGGTVEHFTDLAAVTRALATPFTVDLVPAGDARRRYYYLASLDIESLSLSELEEVEAWLRGDLGRALTERGDVGNALSRGARRLLIRFSGLPRRHIEARTPAFAP